MANLPKKERTRAFTYAAKLRNNAQAQGRSNWTAEEIEDELISQAAQVILSDLHSQKLARITTAIAGLDLADQKTLMNKLEINWDD